MKPNSYNNIVINNKAVDQVSSTKFLGIYIDEKLSWKRHITYIKGKISRAIGIICKARKVLNQSALLN